MARVAVVAPTTHICRQWALDAARYGISLEPNRPNAAGPEPRDRHGVAVTYATVAAGAAVHRRRCAERPTLLIADEPHHMGEDATWGRSTVGAFAKRALPAAAVGHAVPLRQLADPVGPVRRGRGLARGLWLRLHAGAGGRRVPAGHVPHVRRRHGVDERRPRASRRLRRRPAGAPRPRAGCGPRSIPDGDWIAHVLRDADDAAAELRAGTHPDAGGLVVAIDKEHAETLADRLARITGERPDIVHSDAADASARIARFSAGSAPWLVSVLMVSEGVDVPRLRVGVYATTARTELFFRQVIGRFIRRTPAPKDQMSHVFLPSDPKLKALATQIEEERNHALVLEPSDGEDRRARRARRGRRGVPGAVVERAPRRGRAADDPARRRAAAVRGARRRRRSRRSRRPPPVAAGAGDGVRAPRAPARRASRAGRPRSRAGPARHTARSTRASTATSAPRRWTSRPTSSSRRRTACSSARSPAAASLAAWTRSRSGRTGTVAVLSTGRGRAARDPGLDRGPHGPAGGAVRAGAAARVARAAARGPALRADDPRRRRHRGDGDRPRQRHRRTRARRGARARRRADPGPRPRHVRDRRRRAAGAGPTRTPSAATPKCASCSAPSAERERCAPRPTALRRRHDGSGLRARRRGPAAASAGAPRRAPQPTGRAASAAGAGASARGRP